MNNHEHVDFIVKNLRTKDSYELNELFSYAQLCSKLLRRKETEDLGRRILINVLDNWNKIEESYYEIWSDLVESAGFYPYLDKDRISSNLKSTSSNIRKNYHSSKFLEKKLLHEEQFLLKNYINQGGNLIVSAPTSFGKSLLIEEVVASLKYKNIVIIQPTLALLDETRKKLNKYKNDYKIIVRTSQEASFDKGNLFLLTAERVMEYKSLPKIDFFVIDEFYKLSSRRGDERSDVLNNAMNLLLNKHQANFYLLGPNISGISEGFAQQYNAKFYRTNYSLVDNISIDIFQAHEGKFGQSGNKKIYKESVLFNLLDSLKSEQSLIYCSSPARARKLAAAYQIHLSQKNTIQLSSNNLSLIEWIEMNISKEWCLSNCLKYGIGFHDGALQKHISSSIIDYFNSNKINFLFCTSTIIEGVNTSAKNVIYFDEKIGKKHAIDFFDYNNIKGRSGRMMVHYIGKIYNFNKPPKMQEVIIDIPFFEQSPISDEILIHLDEKQIRDKNSDQYEKMMKIPLRERELFKKNGDLVQGQKNILNTLRSEIEVQYYNLNWTTYPNYQQLSYVLNLAWNNLIRENENVAPMTIKKLVKVTMDYSHSQSIMKLVENNVNYYKTLPSYKLKNDNEILDLAIQEAFQTLRHWFQYKVPKWLNVINEIQKFVCKEKNLVAGDFSFFASQIENDFIRENLSILIEYGIPNSAIRKLEKILPSQISEENIIKMIQQNEYHSIQTLIKYERDKLKELF
ncbi:helicase [Paenibacillus bovis]|uniref:Helicase n=2 Tax=Paenibacillus bovis TaxID=1616788 RepID=A0A172ZLP5_9BACL|nr:helicase [Paenibacillus bovis]